MNLTARTQYASVALLELALRREQGEPVPLRVIAEAHGIPLPFLVQIALQLKAAGIVESTRGVSGGYRLVRAPESLTLGEVAATMEGSTNCSLVIDPRSRLASVLTEALREAEQAQQRRLDSTTFSSLVEHARGNQDAMYYI